jgi:hypothetical protein
MFEGEQSKEKTPPPPQYGHLISVLLHNLEQYVNFKNLKFSVSESGISKNQPSHCKD